ncbi:hypothetical protein [Brachybacterium hainanense]|uniref:WXG100 family type VII secretion target n=1 Tax=Brachybacterium hainanense TaxID=1541174 RepID=A0ABV6RGL6_9MICO
MAFQGMDIEAGRDVAALITTTGSEILDIIDQVTSVVNSVEWVGPDYDQYVSDWGSFVSGQVSSLTEAFQAKGDALTQQADQQEGTSQQG